MPWDAPVERDGLLYPNSTYSATKRHTECPTTSGREPHSVPEIDLRPMGAFDPFGRNATVSVDPFGEPISAIQSAYVAAEATASRVSRLALVLADGRHHTRVDCLPVRVSGAYYGRPPAGGRGGGT
jgi:hypothetical protein